MGLWSTIKQYDKQFGATSGLLVVLTILIMVIQYFGLNRSLVIHPGETELNYRSMQQFVEGGQNVEELFTNSDGNLVIACEINYSGTDFQFCSAIISLLPERQGLDLTRFDTLTIDMEFTSTETDTLLFYLLNEPLNKANAGYEVKANMTALLPRNERFSYTFSLTDFYVPSWWLATNNLNQSSSEIELNNVVELQISTGDSRLERMGRIVVHGIRFDGKWLRTDDLYPGIIAFWLAFALLRLFTGYRVLSRSLADHKSSVNTLKSLNKLLDIEKKKFAKMARRDDLTQLYNRAGARDIILRVQENYRMNQVHSSLILFDIDNFKTINDEYGHTVGDKVLTDLAELLLKNTRGDDHVIRWGGEEFVIICEQSPLAKAVQLAEKLRTLIVEKEFADGLNLSCSFGVCEIKSDDSQLWFEQADKNLYQAKQEGKNKVVS